MVEQPCSVCSQAGVHRLGRYNFCETHYPHALHRRRSLWQADGATAVALLLFVVLASLLDRLPLPAFSGNWLLGLGIILSFVPAFIWLAFFYRRDQFEPEPKSLVLKQFILGMLLASAIGIPLVEVIFDTPNWLYHSSIWTQLAGGFFIVGITQEFLVFAAVRFLVFNDPEFDEFTDGIIYATAAGLGVATALNIHRVIESGGVALGNGALMITLTGLAHASFAGILGYFISREKFERAPLWWMPLGLGLAAAANSFFFTFQGMATQGGGSLTGGNIAIWLGFLAAAGMAILIAWALSRAIDYDLQLMTGDNR